MIPKEGKFSKNVAGGTYEKEEVSKGTYSWVQEPIFAVIIGNKLDFHNKF